MVGPLPSNPSTKHGWPLDPSKPCLCISVLSSLLFFFLQFLELLSALHYKFFKPKQLLTPKIRTIGNRTVLCRTNSLSRQNSFDVLERWHQTPSLSDNSPVLVYNYLTFTDRMETVLVSTIFGVHTKHLARNLLQDKEVKKTANSVIESVRQMQARAKKSVKFRFTFKQLQCFLADVEHSSVSTVIRFLQTLANDMLNRPDNWYLAYLHSYCRCGAVPSLLLETTYATYALFMHEGAGVSPHLQKALWREKNRSFNGAMTLLMYCAIEKCAPSCINEINVTEECGTERILDGTKGMEVQKLEQLLGRGHEDLFRDRMMLFFLRNQFIEYVEISWSVDRLERVFWALTEGVEFLEKEKFQQLETFGEKTNVDLTRWDPRVLLSFSLSGMIRFFGENDSVYRLTSSIEAKVEIRGIMPRPTVQDLLKVGLFTCSKKNYFTTGTLPGLGKTLEAKRVDGRLSLQEGSGKAVFCAELCEYVG